MTFTFGKFALVSGVLFLSSFSYAAKPLALIYEGPGSCPVSEGDCTLAAETAAKASGYLTERVGPKALTKASTETDYQTVFSKAAVWVQPGGSSKKFLLALDPALKNGILRFVKSGHGYVGFCAGAFAATEFDGSLELPGLNVFPGKTVPYPNDTIDLFFDEIASHFNPDAYYNQILAVTWNGKKRDLYFEEGATLDLIQVPVAEVEVIATLKNGLPIAARAKYGSGKVFITGGHPEAPNSWKNGLRDHDGADYDLVKEMLDWTTR